MSALSSTCDLRLRTIGMRNGGSVTPISAIFSRMLIISLQIIHTATMQATRNENGSVTVPAQR